MRTRSNRTLVKNVIESLNAAGEEYRVLSAQEAEADDRWLEEYFPISRWGRVEWNDVPESVCISWTDWDERVRRLKEIVADTCRGNPLVVVIWSNALAVSIETSLQTVMAHAPIILAADFDTWILCRQLGWCIEVYHAGEICFGKVRPRTAMHELE